MNVTWKSGLAMAAAAIVACGAPAKAAVLTQNFTLGSSSTQDSYTGLYNIASSIFNEFNSSLGTLTGYSLSLSGTASYNGSGSDNTQYIFSGRHAATVLGFSSGSISGPGTFSFSGSGSGSGGSQLATLNGSDGNTTFINLAFSSPTTVTNGTGSITFTYTAVPEPATFLLLGAPVAAALAGARRRRAGPAALSPA